LSSAIGFQTKPHDEHALFCVEMRPVWYSMDRIPFDSMWADDKFWFPFMLSAKPFYGYFTYRGLDTIVSHEVHCVENFGSLNIPAQPKWCIEDNVDLSTLVNIENRH